MPLRKRTPTSAGRRFQTVSDFAEITKTRPEKSLLAPKPGTGGRNSYGRKTARHRGGGHKQQYRIVDFKRNKDGVPATVAAIESIFSVEVVKVNTLNRKGKRKRNRRQPTFGTRPDVKRAIVTLAPGQTIPILEG